MGFAIRETVSVATDASGDSTDYSGVVSGRIVAVIYKKTDFDDGVDFTITSEDTLQNIWVESNVNAAKTVAPRQPTHSTVGVASLYAAGGEPVEDHVVVVEERIKIVVAQGGNVKTGTFEIIVE